MVTQVDLTDPFIFAKLCWPNMMLYDKQRQIIESVRDNLQTFVPAANETGKTRCAALISLIFYATRSPCRVILFSSSQDQLKQALWPEIKSLVATSRVDFGWRMVEHALTKYKDDRRIETLPQDRLVAHVTTEVERFHGVHLPEDKPRILVVFDEASAVGDEFLEAAESFAHRILVIGNPLVNYGFFYTGCKGGDIENPAGTGLLRKVIPIDGDDSPNVQAARLAISRGKPIPLPILPGLLSWEWMQRRELIWDEETIERRLHGRFYEGAQSMLVPFDWLDHAMDASRWQELKKTERRAEAMGVDVAQGGGDRNVWTVIDNRGIIRQVVSEEGDAVVTAERTMALMREYGLSAGQVAMDSGGGGKEICDMLRHGIRNSASGQIENAPVRVVAFGERPGADDSGRGKTRRKRTAWSDTDPAKAYYNRRAEMYGNLRAMLNPVQPNGGESFMFGPDAWELRKELAPIPLMYDEEGRMRLPPKDERPGAVRNAISVKKLIGCSPDRSDSLVLAIHALKYGRGSPVVVDPGKVVVDQNRIAEMQKRIMEGVAARRATMRA